LHLAELGPIDFVNPQHRAISLRQKHPHARGENPGR